MVRMSIFICGQSLFHRRDAESAEQNIPTSTTRAWPTTNREPPSTIDYRLLSFSFATGAFTSSNPSGKFIRTCFRSRSSFSRYASAKGISYGSFAPLFWSSPRASLLLTTNSGASPAPLQLGAFTARKLKFGAQQRLGIGKRLDALKFQHQKTLMRPEILDGYFAALTVFPERPQPHVLPEAVRNIGVQFDR